MAKINHDDPLLDYYDIAPLPAPEAAAQVGPFTLLMNNSQGGATKIPKKDGEEAYLRVSEELTPEALTVRAHEYGHLELHGPYGQFPAVEVERIFGDTPARLMDGILDVLVNKRLLNRELREIKDLPFYKNKKDFSKYIKELSSISLKTARSIALNIILRSAGLKQEAEAREIVDSFIPSQDLVELLDLRAKLINAAEDQPKEIVEELLPQLHVLWRKLTGEVAKKDYSEEVFNLVGYPSQFLLDYYPLPVASTGSTGNNNWGKLRMKEVPLYPVPGIEQELRQLRRKKAKPNYFGAFRYPLRSLIPAFDGSCFAMPRKQAGGTILVDFSGSMEIEPKELKAVILKSPNMLVAGYGGTGADLGYLGVILKKRRMAQLNEVAFGDANEIDGPALDWLGKQRAPRIWICDGMVTGIGDTPADNLDFDATQKKKAYKVTRYNSLGDYLNGRVAPPLGSANL